MLTRQKTILSLLLRAGAPLEPTVFVKLVFLLRQETGMQSDPRFYDFVPYNFGPFSFALYQDLGSLRRNGYVTPEEERIALCERTLDLSDKKAGELPSSIQTAVTDILSLYGRMNRDALLRDVYARYPWFALNSKVSDRYFVLVQPPRQAPAAVYTAGYKGRSVDAFFNNLLERGIHVIVDVRANPISRKYGFSGVQLRAISEKLGLEYRHVPGLGIPSAARAGLNGFASYQRLLHWYEQTMLPKCGGDLDEVGRLMCRKPSVLVCAEKDVRCCHRTRLAHAVASVTGLEVIHL